MSCSFFLFILHRDFQLALDLLIAIFPAAAPLPACFSQLIIASCRYSMLLSSLLYHLGPWGYVLLSRRVAFSKLLLRIDCCSRTCKFERFVTSMLSYCFCILICTPYPSLRQFSETVIEIFNIPDIEPFLLPSRKWWKYSAFSPWSDHTLETGSSTLQYTLPKFVMVPTEFEATISRPLWNVKWNFVF